MKRVLEAPVRESVSPSGLANIPCNIEFTIKVEGRKAHTYTLKDSNDARNFIARMVPTSIFNSNPELVMSHITDDSQPMFEDLLADAKAFGVPLPAGI